MAEQLTIVWGFYPGNHDVEGDFGNDVFSTQQVVGLGWPETGDLSALVEEQRPVSDFERAVRNAYEQNEVVAVWKREKRERWLRRSAATLHRFLCEAQPGHLIVFANECDEQVYVGRICNTDDGQYKFDAAEKHRLHPHFRHFRAVDWISRISYANCSKEELRQARTQNTFWQMHACPSRFLAAIE